MKLPNSFLGEFSEALQDAFPVLAALDEMVLYRLGENRSKFSTNNGLSAIVYDLLMWTQARDKTTDLLVAARQSNPQNERLIKFARKLEFAPEIVISQKEDDLGPPGLERTIKAINPYLDMAVWNRKSGMIEGQVCKIEYGEKGRVINGTGFLVGPQTILTNYHVVEGVIEGNINPQNVKLQFDYKVSPDGHLINNGIVVQLRSADWLIDHSRYSSADLHKGGVKLPDEDELDYALLFLETDVGNKPIGGNAEPSATKRGWIQLTDQIYNFESSAALLIVQYPQGAPLKLALDTESVIGLNSNGTRVRYRTNTEPGSSGSPCFNVNWELVALHHSGDSNYTPLNHPTYNQGIPTSAIYSYIAKHGKDSYLH